MPVEMRVIDLDYRSGLAILSARHIYSDIGRIISEKDWDVTSGRAYTTRGRKLRLVAKSLIRLALSVPIRFFLRLKGGALQRTNIGSDI